MYLTFSKSTSKLLDAFKKRRNLYKCVKISRTLAIELARQLPSLHEEARRKGETAKAFGERCARRRLRVAWAALVLLGYGTWEAGWAVVDAEAVIRSRTVEQLVEHALWLLE